MGKDAMTSGLLVICVYPSSRNSGTIYRVEFAQNIRKTHNALQIKYCAPTLEENNNVNSSIFTMFPFQYFHVICYARTGEDFPAAKRDKTN